MANEAPITQADISTYIRLIPELDPLERNGSQEAAVYKKYGISRVRYDYVRAKIAVCAGLNAGARHILDVMPKSPHPNNVELGLVRDNWEQISAAAKEYGQKTSQ